MYMVHPERGHQSKPALLLSPPEQEPALLSSHEHHSGLVLVLAHGGTPPLDPPKVSKTMAQSRVVGIAKRTTILHTLGFRSPFCKVNPIHTRNNKKQNPKP